MICPTNITIIDSDIILKGGLYAILTNPVCKVRFMLTLVNHILVDMKYLKNLFFIWDLVFEISDRCGVLVL